jgi:hypothetical protein
VPGPKTELQTTNPDYLLVMAWPPAAYRLRPLVANRPTWHTHTHTLPSRSVVCR